MELEVDGRRVEVPEPPGRCSTCSATSSASHRRRTAAARRASAGAARCWSTARPRVACVTPVRRVAGRRITTLDGLAADERAGRGPTRSAPPAPASAASARPGSSCGSRPARPRGRRRTTTRGRAAPCSPTCAGAPAGGPSSRPGPRSSAHAATPPTRDLEAAARAGDDRGRQPAAGRPRGGARRGRLRRRHRAGRRARRGARRPGRMGGRRDARRGAGRGRQGAGSAHHRRRRATRSRCPTATGRSRCRRRGSSPPTSRPTRRGARPAASRRRRSANGGAFGGKVRSPVAGAARALADQHGRPVRVLLSREDTVRLGPEAPAGRRRACGADGSGVIRVVRTPGIAEAIASVAPELDVEEVDVRRTADVGRRCGPPGGPRPSVLLAGLPGARRHRSRSPDGRGGRGRRSTPTGRSRVRVALRRSARRGRAALATASAPPTWRFGWVTSEGLAVDADGAVHDLTIRSFGVLRAVDTPPIDVEIEPRRRPAGQRLRRGVRRGGRRARGSTGDAAPTARYSPHPPRSDRTMTQPNRSSVHAGRSGPVTGWSCPVRSAWPTASWSAGGFDAELRQALANLRCSLAGEGATLADVVKTTVFLRHMTRLPADERGLRERFGEPPPGPVGVRGGRAPARRPRRDRGLGVHRRARLTRWTAGACSEPLSSSSSSSWSSRSRDHERRRGRRRPRLCSLKDTVEHDHEGSELIDLNTLSARARV